MGKIGRARKKSFEREGKRREKVAAPGRLEKGVGITMCGARVPWWGASRVVEVIEGGEVHRRSVLLPCGRAFCAVSGVTAQTLPRPLGRAERNVI